MLKQNLSAVFVIALTIFGLGFYFHAREGENAAMAANVVGSTFADIGDGNARIARQAAWRQAVRVDADALMDVYGRDVLAVFDAPEMVRRDAPTTVWQYRNARCVLDLYFTTSQLSAEAAPVVHYEVRLREDGALLEDQGQACVRGLLRQGRSL